MANKSTTKPAKKGSKSPVKASTSRSKAKDGKTTTKAPKTAQKGSKRANRKVTEVRKIEVVDKSRKSPQEIAITFIYNPEKEVKYLMTSLDTKEAWQVLKRIWKFYRQLKKARKLEAKVQKNQRQMYQTLNNLKGENE